MDIGSIFLILGLLVLVGLFVSRPLFESADVGRAYTSKREHDVSALMAERDRVLNALQELDFDYALGKIPEEDYPSQRAVLLQRGANILREMDSMVPAQPAEKAEDRLEAAIAARKGTGASPSMQERRKSPGSDDQLEQVIANRRRERNEKSAGFCPNCGGPLQKSDRFCPKCGEQIA